MYGVERQSEVLAGLKAETKTFDIETLFRTHYARIVRIIGRVVRDRARAEELAGEVFLKLWRRRVQEVDHVEGWLYRVAVNAGLDELRRERRRARYEELFQWVQPERSPATPEELFRANQEKERVRRVLGSIPEKHAAILLLRSQGFSYGELGTTLGLNPTSVGVLLARAREAFQKEYTKIYGQE
jgi:RNA polymerase sigma factor (sigma-70 family)